MSHDSNAPHLARQRHAAANAADALTQFMRKAPDDDDALVPVRLGDGGDAVQVPSNALGLLRDALGELGEGHDVELLRRDREVSTAFAAQLLGVSRPHFVKLLDEQHVMPFHKVGRDRRVQLSDVLAYRVEFSGRRSQALHDLVHHSEGIGLYDDEG